MSRHLSRAARKACAFLAVMLFIILTSAQPGLEAQLELAKRATVFLYQADSGDDNLAITCVSAGTLISADGLIISNAGGVARSEQCPGDTLVVSLNVTLNEPPIPKYRAEIASLDRGLDIALLRITRELDGRLIAREDLPILPFVSIGDSQDIDIDDNLTFVGYSGIGNDPVASSRGTVTAFIAEPPSSRAWLKTRAEIPGAMAGGGAYNTSGELIGIPTNAPLAGLAGDANCRYLDDSNGDGLVNSSDHCVPLGDFISTIRPIGLAQSMIRGARLGLKVDLAAQNADPAASILPPRISRMFFAPSAQAGMPSTVVGALPANTRNLYLFFDYDNMRADMAYELRVTRDGLPERVFSLPPVRWSGGEAGLWHIGAREQAWANGMYEFTLLVNGASLGSQQILVGGGLEERGQFSDIAFGTLDHAGSLVGNGSIVPVSSVAYARFLYAKMPLGSPWSVIWHYRGVEFARSNDIWSEASHGSKVISIGPEGGLLPGEYRLELYIDGGLSATSDFFVAGSPGAPLPKVFSNLRFVSAASTEQARLASASASYPTGVSKLYALFDWQRIETGTPWSLRLLVDEQAFFHRSYRWAGSQAGSDFPIAIPAPPDGSYELQLLVNNLVLADLQSTVGIGQLPIDRFAQFEGTLLSGTVLDGATRQGIPNISIALISEDYAASEFEWRGEQLVDLTTSDRNGAFQFARPLAFDTNYSVVIEADGYIPQAADGFSFPQTQASAHITIEMARG